MIWIACALTAVIAGPLGLVAGALIANHNISAARAQRQQLTEW